MELQDELARVLPPEIPHRDRLIQVSSSHIAQIMAANEYMNLTRISDAREAAIKHIFDSVAPWEMFRNARRVLDAGTGAGFPGVPLSVVLPEARFTLAESTRKKAHFVESVVDTLELPNVKVAAERAEDLLSSCRPDVITARAVAPLHRLVELFGKALKNGTRLLLYKGPDVQTEIDELRGLRVVAEVVKRYELPDELGSRTLVRVAGQKRPDLRAS